MSGECQGEMLDYRRMLMEDYSLSPEIVLHCRGEIDTHCSGLHHKGRTLHCLMRVSRDKGVSDNLCQKAVSSVLQLELVAIRYDSQHDYQDYMIFFKVIEKENGHLIYLLN